MANKELKSIRFPGLTDTYTVNSMPDGAGANMQLVTDADGVAKWEEKPFYSTQEEITVTWDGDTTGREVISYGTYVFYKVSDSIIHRDNVIGRTFTLTTESGSEDHVITEDMCLDVSYAIPGAWAVILNENAMLGSGPAFDTLGSSGGLYYTKIENLYVSSLSFIGESINTIEQKYLPEIPAEKLPEIPAEKLPEIPAEKLPEIPAEKLPDLVVELSNFTYDNLIANTQIQFSFSNVTYAELLEAAKKAKVILKNSNNIFYVIPNGIIVNTKGDIEIRIMFYRNNAINEILILCLANREYFYRNSWHKASAE